MKRSRFRSKYSNILSCVFRKRTPTATNDELHTNSLGLNHLPTDRFNLFTAIGQFLTGRIQFIRIYGNVRTKKKIKKIKVIVSIHRRMI